MSLSQKCQYAVRAVLELAKKHGSGPVTIGDIAAEQAIPARFLEMILNELKQGGHVGSRRGIRGGYFLVTPPNQLNVGEIIRFIDGPLDPVKCVNIQDGKPCRLKDGCALVGLWTRAKNAVEEVYEKTTFQDLVEAEREAQQKVNADFCI